MKKFLAMFCGLISVLFAAGCCCFSDPAPASAEPEAVTITRTQLPVTVDGVLDEKVWTQAVRYPMLRHCNWDGLPEKTARRVKNEPLQNGSFRLLYDKEYLYLGVEFEDSDIIAESSKNQTRLYRSGDLAELFLTPGDGHAYFEIYLSPSGAYTFYLFPGGGVSKLPSMFDENRKVDGIKTAVKINGTLNRSNDVDKTWSGELAIPLKNLSVFGSKFASGTSWSILVARYNYAVHLRKMQFSGVPVIPPEASYGDVEYHAPVKFAEADNN